MNIYLDSFIRCFVKSEEQQIMRSTRLGDFSLENLYLKHSNLVQCFVLSMFEKSLSIHLCFFFNDA